MRRNIRSSMNPVSCPGCGSGAVRLRGAIPDNRMFAGRDVGSMPARLAVCDSCHLGFRTPQPRQSELADMYASGSETAWIESSEQVRRDWEMAVDWVKRSDASRVLDVGCFDGGFLELLPASVFKAGVEINGAASKRAGERGVEILASDLHHLAEVAEQFDFVSAFDVVEHVHDPSAFLATLSTVVLPGGFVVISTGNLDALAWRAMGSRYLYSWYQEHLSFVSPQWVRRQAPRLGFDVVAIDRFSHTADARFGFLIGMLKNGAYKMSPQLVDAVRAKTNRSRTEEVPDAPIGPPVWRSARDHIFVVLRKTG